MMQAKAVNARKNASPRPAQAFAAAPVGWTQWEGHNPMAQREAISISRMRPGVLAQYEAGAEPSDDDSGNDLAEEEEEEMLDLQFSECKVAYEAANCKRMLMSMCLGLRSDDDKDRSLGDPFQEPYYSIKQRASFLPTSDDLKAEMQRRAKQFGIEAPKSKYYSKKKCTDWLIDHPVIEYNDVAFLQRTEQKIVDDILEEKAEKERMKNDKNEKEAREAWRTNEPFLRMYLCMLHESAIEALLRKDDCMDRETLDARNNQNRPLNWYEIVAKLWNDRSLVLTTEALPDLHSSFAFEIELKREDMPDGDITGDDVKSRFADCRAMLIKIIYDWEKSGNGFGQNEFKDPGWGHFTEEHFLQDGDNRANFLRREYANKEHLLMLWHLGDTQGLLSNMLNVLSKEVSIDCDGNIIVDTAQVQTKRKKAEEESDRKEKKAFRTGVARSMERLSYASVQDSLRLARKQAMELEIKYIEATSTSRKEVYKKMLDLEQENLEDLKKQVDFMNSKLSAEIGEATEEEE